MPAARSSAADTSSPYSFTWSSAPAGSYTLTAMAFDADGGQTTSSAVSITVQPGPNQPPSVSLTSPANGATFTAPATIDDDRVGIGSGEPARARRVLPGQRRSLGTDSSSPYSFTWSSAPAGSYTLTARAFDSDGAQTTSAAVSITVNAEPAAVRVADLARQRRDVHRAGDDHDDRVGIGSGEPARARRVLPRRHAARHRLVFAVLVHLVVGARRAPTR